MKTLACVIGLVALNATAQAQDAQARRDIESARDAVWRSWFAGDTAKLARLLPGALAAGSSDGWEDRATSIADARKFAANGGRLVDLRFDSTTITIRGKVAVVQARYTYTLEDRGGKRQTSRGFATEVFVKEQGRWTNPFWYLRVNELAHRISSFVTSFVSHPPARALEHSNVSRVASSACA